MRTITTEARDTQLMADTGVLCAFVPVRIALDLTSRYASMNVLCAELVDETSVLLISSGRFLTQLKQAVWKHTHDKTQPYGNGALVVSRGQACERSRYVKIINNDFAVAPGCGDRELVQLEGAERIIFSNNTLASGANLNTVVVDSMDSVNSSLCGFGCRTRAGAGCLPSVDDSWMLDGALQYSCDNIANHKTTFRGRSIPTLCEDSCCKPQ